MKGVSSRRKGVGQLVVPPGFLYRPSGCLWDSCRVQERDFLVLSESFTFSHHGGLELPLCQDRGDGASPSSAVKDDGESDGAPSSCFSAACLKACGADGPSMSTLEPCVSWVGPAMGLQVWASVDVTVTGQDWWFLGRLGRFHMHKTFAL